MLLRRRLMFGAVACFLSLMACGERGSNPSEPIPPASFRVEACDLVFAGVPGEDPLSLHHASILPRCESPASDRARFCRKSIGPVAPRSFSFPTLSGNADSGPIPP
jgi:hypothetical protein